ncbi:MAG: DUF4358 domain-containing protein [Clostridia bacterium]|nr:DUF4358 domain-containing protein [Clostridia bacterium]MBO5066752.1 DUF4358 domain-containing protein [Clostridia bacterium]
MIKKITAILMVAIMILSFASCGGAGDSGEKAEAPKTIDLQAIKAEMITQFNIDSPIDLDNDKLLNQYGITAESVKSSGSFIVLTGIFPAEIVMIEAVDENAAKEIKDKLQARLDDLKVQSQSYDAESYSIAQNCSIFTNGNYVAMFFSEHGAEMENLYLKYFE